MEILENDPEKLLLIFREQQKRMRQVVLPSKKPTDKVRWDTKGSRRLYHRFFIYLLVI